MNISYEIVDNPTKFTAGREGRPIEYIVLHTYAGKGDSLYSWFQNLSPRTSAHYSVSLSGVVRQYVWEANTAYHAGNLETNYRSIGIEHQDNGEPTTVQRTDEQYEASARLVFEICLRNSIPVDRSRIKLHREILLDGNNSAKCPGNLDFDRIVNRAAQLMQEYNTPAPAPDDFYRVFVSNTQIGAFNERDNAFELWYSKRNEQTTVTFKGQDITSQFNIMATQLETEVNNLKSQVTQLESDKTKLDKLTTDLEEENTELYNKVTKLADDLSSKIANLSKFDSAPYTFAHFINLILKRNK